LGRDGDDIASHVVSAHHVSFELRLVPDVFASGRKKVEPLDVLLSGVALAQREGVGLVEFEVKQARRGEFGASPGLLHRQAPGDGCWNCSGCRFGSEGVEEAAVPV
jgi:hypothetical protein